MKRILFLLFVVAQCASLAQGKFKVDFDYSKFHYDNANNYLEIYYSFFQPDLTVLRNENSEKIIKGVLNVIIIDQAADTAVVNKNYQFSNVLTSSDSASGRSLTGNLGFLLPHGKYSVYLAGVDGHDSTRIDSVNFNLEIKNFSDDRFAVSDIELASSIQESQNTNSLFYKNTFEVVPNPSSIYGEPLPVIYFYSELYDIDKNIASPLLKIEHILLNSQNEPFFRKTKMIGRKSSSVVEVGAINITKAPSGTYLLVVAVSDSLLNQTVYSTKRLFIYNPSILDTSVNVMIDQDVMSSEFAAMSEEELEEAFSASRYVATSQELDQWSKISDLSGRRSFLFNFWKARDNDPGTPVNETKRDYFSRVDKANLQFGTMQKKGWKTDRGRVFITYGEPSEIERYPNQVDTKPYEIWQYNQLEGGVIFIFADITGFSDYLLVHSTHRSELRDDNWQRKIATY